MAQRLNILQDLQTPDNAQEFYQNYLAYDSWIEADKIIQRYGRGTFTYYDEITDSDAIISGCMESRINQVAALEWSVEPASEDERDLITAEYINGIFNNMDYFHEYLVNILSSLRNGFSVQLVNWILHDGNYIPQELLSCNPDYFRFGKDRKLRIIEVPGAWQGTEVDDYRFLVMSFQPRYSNPYGVSLLRSVYWAWWFKHHGMKWWLQAAERGAVVTPVGKYTRNASDDEINKLVEACKLFKGNQYIVTLDENSIDFPAIKVDPELTRLLVDTLDEAIRYRIEGSVLASGTASSGTRALGEIHEKKTQVRIESDAKALMIVVNRLVKWIMDLNFANTDYPLWKLHYQPEDDTTAMRENLKVIVPLGAKISATKVIEMMSLPQALEDEDILVAPSSGGTGITTPQVSMPKEDIEDEEESNNDEETEDETVSTLAQKKIPLTTELDEIMRGWKD